MPASIFTAKIVGTMSVGLWAGYSLSLIHHPKDAAIFGSTKWAKYFENVSSGRFSVQKVWLDLRQFVERAIHCSGCATGNFAPADQQKAEVENSSVSLPFDASKLLELGTKALRISALSGAVFVSNMVAFTMSSASGKHPYLLYLALGAPLVGALQYFGAQKLYTQALDQVLNEQSSSSTQRKEEDSEEDPDIISDLSSSAYENIRPHSSTSSAKEADSAESFNAKASPVFTLQHKYAIFSSVVAGLSTFLYAISVIGLAGDTRF